MKRKVKHLSRTGLFLGISVLALLFVARGVHIRHRLQTQAAVGRMTPLPATTTLKELLATSPGQAQGLDIALVNLLCIEGLPEADGVNVPESLVTLDQWAQRVKIETERHLYHFRANPAEYSYSEAYFRMLMMAVVVYEDFGVRYNPERITIPASADPNDRFFADSRDIFLHGLLGSRKMGTCSSMPVLYVALGRRLGYPLKLVTTKSHLFLRWEDGKERFNLEATGKGMSRYDDAHFQQWPFPVSDEEVRTEGYLKSLTAAEELAVFVSLRGNCLKEAGRTTEAISCYAEAARLAPGWRAYRVLMADAENRSATPVGAPETALPTVNSAVPTGQAAVADPNPLLKIR